MTIEELLREKRDDIRRIAAKHGVRDLRVFGSVARGEAGPNSDIDLLVDVGPNTSSCFPMTSHTLQDAVLRNPQTMAASTQRLSAGL